MVGGGSGGFQIQDISCVTVLSCALSVCVSSETNIEKYKQQNCQRLFLVLTVGL